MSIFVTGDIHGTITKLQRINQFAESGDHVIVCGDFGIPFADTEADRKQLELIDEFKFTTWFVDGNHENFDLLNQYPIVVDEFSNCVHKVSEKVRHMIRGNIYNIEGKRFFAFGGARSVDVIHGILDKDDPELYFKIKQLESEGKFLYRVEHRDWWTEEMPSPAEVAHAFSVLKEANYDVDYIITHAAPTEMLKQVFPTYETDFSNTTLQSIYEDCRFKKWFCGHYHKDYKAYEWFEFLFNDIVQI